MLRASINLDLMKITILGAGNFGTALGVAWARGGHKVTFWAIEEKVVKDIETKKTNSAYAKGVKLPSSVKATSDMEKAVSGADVVVVAVSSKHVRSVIGQAKPFIDKEAHVFSVAKGFDPGTDMLMPQVLLDVLPSRLATHVGHMSGPSFASDIMNDVPTIVTLALKCGRRSKKLSEGLSTKTFRLLPSRDYLSTALGGACKNAYVIGLGLVSELYKGDDAKAIIVDKAVKEMGMLAVALGGKEESIYGPAGIGDLVLTGFGGSSRNLKFGKMRAKSSSTQKVIDKIGSTVEGVYAVEHIVKLARKHKLKLPLASAIYRVVHKGANAKKEIDKALKV